MIATKIMTVAISKVVLKRSAPDLLPVDGVDKPFRLGRDLVVTTLGKITTKITLGIEFATVGIAEIFQVELDLVVTIIMSQAICLYRTNLVVVEALSLEHFLIVLIVLIAFTSHDMILATRSAELLHAYLAVINVLDLLPVVGAE